MQWHSHQIHSFPGKLFVSWLCAFFHSCVRSQTLLRIHHCCRPLPSPSQPQPWELCSWAITRLLHLAASSLESPVSLAVLELVPRTSWLCCSVCILVITADIWFHWRNSNWNASECTNGLKLVFLTLTAVVLFSLFVSFSTDFNPFHSSASLCLSLWDPL